MTAMFSAWFDELPESGDTRSGNNGTAFRANDPEDMADWDYIDGALILSENPTFRIEMPDRIQFSSVVTVASGYEHGDGNGVEGLAQTDVMLEHASTVTCRK